MSRLHPKWDDIRAFRTPLTEGEMALVTFLEDNLPQKWEIFVQPFMNGDRPDIIILHPDVGLTIFEVKDWDLKHYCRENRQHFVLDQRGRHRIADPYDQVDRYRKNLLNLYVASIGERVHQNKNFLLSFRVALYFHRAKTEDARQFVDVGTSKAIVFGYDALKPHELENIVPDAKRTQSKYMESEWVEQIRFWLTPPFHPHEQNTQLKLTVEQKRHVNAAPGQHQRLEGVAGSGKTLVLAQRAANIAAQGRRVLIVTYNITLLHYIRDHIRRAECSFMWAHIEFAHFHGFCRDYLLENDVPWPERSGASNEEFFNRVIPNAVLSTLNEGKNKKGRLYDAILIDEGQDFEKPAYDVLCKFLSSDDELFFAADRRQNLYLRDGTWIEKMTGTKFRGQWRRLRESYRFPPIISRIANHFAQQFLNPDEEPIGVSPQQSMFDPHVVWQDIDNFAEARDLALIIYTWLTKVKDVHPVDIVILVPTHNEGWELVKHFGYQGISVNHVFEQQKAQDNWQKRHYHKKSFWMGDARLKMSTIHSFKGWELKNVIIVTPEESSFGNRIANYLLYTAMTRTRENLIVLNRHSQYQAFGHYLEQNAFLHSLQELLGNSDKQLSVPQTSLS